MSRLAFVVALLALGCGAASGRDGALFDEVRGGAGGAAGAVAGSGGAPVSSGGSEAQAGDGSAGEAPAVTGGGGQVSTAGSGGEDTGGAGAIAGSAGIAAGGGAGAAAGGSSGAPAGGTGGQGQSGSTSEGGAGGEQTNQCPTPVPANGCSVCSSDDVLDCNGVAGDGLNQLEPNDCEAWKGAHGSCGACGKKCGLSQVCKIGGSPGAWTYYCQTP